MKKKYLINLIIAITALTALMAVLLFSCSKEEMTRFKPPHQLIMPETPETPTKPHSIERHTLAELYERGEDWVVEQYGKEFIHTCGLNWEIDDWNYVLENQVRQNIGDVRAGIQKPLSEITTEYFEKEYQQRQQIALDIRIASNDTIDYYTFGCLPYTLDDLILDQIAINAKVGDLVMINVRTLVPFPPTAPIMGYFSGTATGGIWVIPGQSNPDKWARIVAEMTQQGYVNIGTKITGLKKSILITVN